jgi:hypothetical protein
MTLDIWILKDIMELIDSRKLAITLADLQKYQSDCEQKRRQLASARYSPSGLLEPQFNNGPEGSYLTQITNTLKDAEEVCAKAKWGDAKHTISLINIHAEYQKEECDWSSFAADLRTALGCIITAMWVGRFVRVSTQYSEYVNNDTLMGDAVQTAFPSAKEDIREAGNCIAVDCGTAAVFHLMRAVEWGVRALCVDLGVLTVPRKKATIPIEFSEWDKILDQVYPAVNAKIDALSPGPQKQEWQEFYFPLLLDIRGFKDAFRNHVMHTRQTYSQKAADDVLDYVRRFFVLLSTRISE